MNGDTSITKRKKAPTDKEDGDCDRDGNVERGYRDIVSTHGGIRDCLESIVIPGCGRVVCRACCIESVPKQVLILCRFCWVLIWTM